jgi:cytoskeletal protein RodZ
MAEYGVDVSLQQVLDDEPDRADDSAESDSAPDPWYRNRVLLALWALAVALVLTLIIYGLVELSRGGEGGVPATTTPSTSHTRSSTTSPTTTTTTTPSSSSETPPPETPEQTPEEAPPPPNTYSPAPSEPPRHHHHLHLPHLPQGFF